MAENVTKRITAIGTHPFQPESAVCDAGRYGGSGSALCWSWQNHEEAEAGCENLMKDKLDDGQLNNSG